MKWQTEPLTYSNASHVAEVEVDVETAMVTISRYVALQDVGVQVNPMIVDGQIRGGIAHGVGNALSEFMAFGDDGQPLSASFMDYALPRAAQTPRCETLYRVTPSPINPLGAKGVGEVGTIPVAAAIVSAIEDALSPLGVTIAQTPVLPQALFDLIAAARARGASRRGAT